MEQMEKVFNDFLLCLETFYELMVIPFFNKKIGWHMLSKVNNYYSHKIYSQGDTSTVVYFSKFGAGKDLHNSILLKGQIRE